ncbi:MAG: iron-containing alcohol dehydrogenase [Betaproteobacteria bacterium]|nr:iron-containing alcohol dehydrogenase [Betaproteobacteria bacterium]
MKIADFAYNSPAHRLVFGWGCRAALKDELKRLDVRRPMLVCSPRAARSSELLSLVRSLGLTDESVFSKVGLHAPLDSAFEGSRRARALEADCLVSFGGGSASDTMKGIALACAEDGRLLDFTLERLPDGTVKNPLSTRPKLPSIAIPTTVSGADITPAFALTEETGKKILFRDASVAPRVLVYDPELMASVPARSMSESGMNALAHTIEALYSKARNPVSGIHAREAVPLLYRGLHAIATGSAQRDDYTALALGAYYAGVAITNARTGLHHSICHKLGPAVGLTHGLTNSIVLPHVLQFNLPAAREELAAMAELIQDAGVGVTARTPEEAIAAVQGLSKRAGLPIRLRDANVSREKLPGLAQVILNEPGLAFNPRPVESAAQIQALLESAW